MFYKKTPKPFLPFLKFPIPLFSTNSCPVLKRLFSQICLPINDTRRERKDSTMRKSYGKSGNIFSRMEGRMVPDFAWVKGTGLWLLLIVFLSLSLSGRVEAGTNQWTSYGPEGEKVRALVIDPVTPTTVYAGTCGGGVFKSTDGGSTWAAINTGLTNPYVSAIAIDPITPNTLYAGTGGKAFKSTDGGTNWVHTGLPSTAVRTIAIDPVTPNTLYAGTWGGGVFVYGADQITVPLDIKPSSDLNPINLKSNGVIPVAILTTDEFDATTVDGATVRFGPNEAEQEHYALEDIDNDGDVDMILHFRTQDTGIGPDDDEVTLIGETLNGDYLTGTDSIRIVPKKGNK